MTALDAMAFGAAKRIHIVQGEFAVSDDVEAMLTTVLGSCVAACLTDPAAGVGGMNHFLLPRGGPDQDGGPGALRYGVHAMELLLNALYRQGARRERLEARLFGGARMLDGLPDVGAKNAAFAEDFLSAEGIRLAGGSLRGTQGRRIQFWPASGRVRQALIDQTPELEPIRPAPAIGGELELF